MTPGLSKSRIVAWRQCPRRLWLQVHRPELLQTSAADERNFQIGFEVGEVARGLYPDGILIDSADLGQALAATREALDRYPQRPIFEATFERERVLVQVDLLLPEGERHRMVEVKASTGVKPYHRDDCAIQAWVVGTARPLAGVELTHIDNRFVYGGGGAYAGLFRHNPLDEEIGPLLGLVPDWVAGARATLEGDDPATPPGEQCGNPFACPFQDHCGANPPQAEFPLGLLPHFSGKKREALEAMGIQDLREIPDDFPLTRNQARVRAATLANKAELSPEAAMVLDRLPYPRCYLDFESMSLAVPRFVGTKPYQAIPVQWSCHGEAAVGQYRHEAHLAAGDGDPRPAFADSLIAAVGETGPVFVYNRAFEGRILRELAEALPDRAPALLGIIQRLFDLLPLTREHYYHPAMRGSWSIKAVLPTIDPKLSYSEMAIGDGGTAEGAWREIFHPATPLERKAALRQSLAEYCQLDTWAMVRLAGFLAGR